MPREWARELGALVDSLTRAFATASPAIVRGRVDQRNYLSPSAAVDPEIAYIGGDDGALRMQFAHADQTEIG